MWGEPSPGADLAMWGEPSPGADVAAERGRADPTMHGSRVRTSIDRTVMCACAESENEKLRGPSMREIPLVRGPSE